MYVALIAWRPSYQQLTGLLIWIGGVLATIIGSWIASKIRIYHDSKRGHHEDLKAKVLSPLCEAVTKSLPLFQHRQPVVVEAWDRLAFAKVARAEEDAARYGAVLQSVNPWTDVFETMDRALFEDAKTRHHRALMAEVSALADSWEAHSHHCLMWVSAVAADVLKASKMNPYEPPVTPPYVLHLRVGVFIYRRLFDLPTEVLRKESQGKYWSIEGAPTVPNVIGSASLGNENDTERLLEIVNQNITSNRERAAQLAEDSRRIYVRAVELRRKLELAIASKKLGKGCNLVPFF